MSWRRIAAAWAGPLLIAAFAVFAMRGFVASDTLTAEHPDLLAFWLPRWSFLGRSIAEGTIPIWNPYEMTGYRFAADPQSGWLYAPPMLLFSTLSPGVAMRAMVALHPLLAGLGMYAFLRVDGLGRIAATIGGLALTGIVGASEIAIAMPFAGAVAWSTIVLLGAAGFARAERWRGRLPWLALAGFAWSQVAGAHLSHGLVVGTVVVAAYLVARAWHERGLTWGRVAVFLVALPLLSLAVLVPRLQFIDASSLGEGYDALGRAAVGSSSSIAATEQEEPPIAEGGVWAGWPLAFASAPGAYAGAAALTLVPLALVARRRRHLVASFGGVLLATWVLLLPLVLGAGWVRAAIGALPYGDVVLHNPGRLRYVAVLALPVLAATGIQGLLDEPMPVRRLVAYLVAGAALWLVLPLAAGAAVGHWALFAVGAAFAVPAIVLVVRDARWAPALVAVLVVDLTIGVLLGNAWEGDEIRVGLEGSGGTPLAFQPLRSPDLDLEAFLTPTAFVEPIGEDRYLTWAPPAAAYEKGYLHAQDPWDWPALANERGTLFGIRESLGYNPVQLPRYWAWVRAVNPLPVAYNAAVLARPRPADVQVLGARYLVVPQGVAPTVPGTVMMTADGYDLVRVDGATRLVEFRGSWEVVDSPQEALATVASPRYDERATVVLEEDPGLTPSSGTPGGVRATFASPSETRVSVGAVRPGVLLVRTAFDPNWRASVDGEPATVLVADGFLQAVAMPDGRHEVVLSYEDPWVLRGLLLGAIAWIVLGALWLGSMLARRAPNARAAPAERAPAATPTPADAVPPR